MVSPNHPHTSNYQKYPHLNTNRSSAPIQLPIGNKRDSVCSSSNQNHVAVRCDLAPEIAEVPNRRLSQAMRSFIEQELSQRLFAAQVTRRIHHQNAFSRPLSTNTDLPERMRLVPPNCYTQSLPRNMRPSIAVAHPQMPPMPRKQHCNGPAFTKAQEMPPQQTQQKSYTLSRVTLKQEVGYVSEGQPTYTIARVSYPPKAPSEVSNESDCSRFNIEAFSANYNTLTQKPAPEIPLTSVIAHAQVIRRVLKASTKLGCIGFNHPTRSFLKSKVNEFGILVLSLALQRLGLDLEIKLSQFLSSHIENTLKEQILEECQQSRTILEQRICSYFHQELKVLVESCQEQQIPCAIPESLEEAESSGLFSLIQQLLTSDNILLYDISKIMKRTKYCATSAPLQLMLKQHNIVHHQEKDLSALAYALYCTDPSIVIRLPSKGERFHHLLTLSTQSSIAESNNFNCLLI